MKSLMVAFFAIEFMYIGLSSCEPDDKGRPGVPYGDGSYGILINKVF